MSRSLRVFSRLRACRRGQPLASALGASCRPIHASQTGRPAPTTTPASVLQLTRALHHLHLHRHRRGGDSGGDSASLAGAAVGMTVEQRSALERALANAVGRAMGLPPRLLWPVAADVRAATAAACGGRDRRAEAPPVTAVDAFVWRPAFVSTDGEVVVRQGSSPGAPALTAAQLTSPSAVEAVAGAVYRLASGGGGGDGAHSGGGGVWHPAREESYAVLLHTARAQGLARCCSGALGGGVSSDELARAAQRLVVYASDQCDPLLPATARLLGFAHVRLVQTVAVGGALRLPVAQLKRRLAEDVAAGLYPCLIAGVCGSGLSGAVDPLAELAALCARTQIWLHADASAAGLALLAQGGDHGEVPPAVQDMQRELRSAASLCLDSVCVCAGPTAAGLPARLQPPDCASPLSSMLYVASAAKVAVALRQLPGSRQAGEVNGWELPLPGCSPAAPRTAWEALSLSAPPAAAELVSLASGTLSALDGSGSSSAAHSSTDAPPPSAYYCRDVPRALAAHLALVAALRRRLREAAHDWDVGVDGTAAGLLHLRWTLRADEHTRLLAHHWRQVLAERHRLLLGGRQENEGEEGALATTTATKALPVVIHIGVVALQKRPWVVASLGAFDPSRADDVQRFFLETLQEAASRV